MQLTLDKFRATLVLKIIYADSTEDLKKFLSSAIQTLKKQKITGDTISGLSAKIISQLEKIQTVKTNTLSNISAAKSMLLQIVNGLTPA